MIYQDITMERVYVDDLISGYEYLIYLRWNLAGERISETIVCGRAYDFQYMHAYTYIEFLVKDQYGDERITIINSANPMYCKPERMPDDLKCAIVQRQQLIANPKQTRDTKHEIIYHPICVFANPSDYFSSETIDRYGLDMMKKMAESIALL
jgi:hypothetical protein